MVKNILKTVRARKSSSWYNPEEQSKTSHATTGMAHAGRGKEDVEVKPKSLRVGDVVSVENVVKVSENESLTSLIVGTVIKVNKEKKSFTVSKSEDDRTVELSFYESRVFRLFHDKNFKNQAD